jgi:hypothetical protein
VINHGVWSFFCLFRPFLSAFSALASPRCDLVDWNKLFTAGSVCFPNPTAFFEIQDPTDRLDNPDTKYLTQPLINRISFLAPQSTYLLIDMSKTEKPSLTFQQFVTQGDPRWSNLNLFLSLTIKSSNKRAFWAHNQRKQCNFYDYLKLWHYSHLHFSRIWAHTSSVEL